MAITKVSRRDFVRITSLASAGLVLGVSYAATPKKAAKRVKTESVPHDLGAFVQIGDDGIVTIWVPKSDMGQGVRTALPMMVADEMDADWSRVRVRQAFLDKKFGRMGTGGSSSVRTMWTPMRTAGATARAMLVTAAAAKLGVPAESLTVSEGVISAPSGKKVTFGEIATDAAKVAVPAAVKLKDPSKFTIIGRKTDRVDNHDIVTGKAIYGIDVKLPGMLYAVVKRSPAFGGKVVSFDDTKAKAVAGVKKVVAIEATGPVYLPWNGVAVIADSTWAAMKGREALTVKFDTPPSESTESLRKQLADAVTDSAKVVHEVGNADSAIVSASKTIDAIYEMPFLAHATMEPMNATASVTADGVEIWAPTQFVDWIAKAVSEALKVPPEKVKVNVTLLGGGFGRRAMPDFAVEAALLSKAAGAPVKVQWTREDDMQHDYYRPASYHHALAGLDPEGRLIAWYHQFAAPSIESYMNAKTEKPGESETGGLTDMPYNVPNFRVEFASVPSVVPRGWWRSVENSITGFVVNSLLDEVAVAAGRDPIDLRLSLLPPGTKLETESKEFPFEADRFRRVIELVREKANWKRVLEDGRGRGFAAHFSFLSYVAQVADVTKTADGIRIDRIVTAIDCGTPVNPDGIAAQVEGAIVYGLTAALYGEITTSGGAVKQTNFDDYPLLRITSMPKIEVYVVPSTAAPTGTGEPGLPPLAPAVANAIYAATGHRLRSMPFKTIKFA